MFYMQHFSKQMQAIIIANQWAKSFPGPAPRLTLFSIVFNLFLFWCERFFSLQNRLFVHFIWIATKIYVANDIPKPPTKNNGNLCAWKQCEFIGVIWRAHIHTTMASNQKIMRKHIEFPILMCIVYTVVRAGEWCTYSAYTLKAVELNFYCWSYGR